MLSQEGATAILKEFARHINYHANDNKTRVTGDYCLGFVNGLLVSNNWLQSQLTQLFTVEEMIKRIMEFIPSSRCNNEENNDEQRGRISQQLS